MRLETRARWTAVTVSGLAAGLFVEWTGDRMHPDHRLTVLLIFAGIGALVLDVYLWSWLNEIQPER